MNFVNDQRISWLNASILKPATRNASRNDDHVPRRRIRRRFAFAIDDAHPQILRAQYRFGNRANRECFAGTRSGDNAKAFAAGRERKEFFALRALQEGVDVQANCEFNGLARGAGWRNHNDAARRRLGRHKSVVVGRQVAVARISHTRNLTDLRLALAVRAADLWRPTERNRRVRGPVPKVAANFFHGQRPPTD